MKNTNKTKLFSIIFIFALFLYSCVPDTTQPSTVPPPEITPQPVELSDNTVETSGDILEVIVLDVGQADCILIKTGGAAMLIDAGNLGQDELILGYLEQYSVTKLDYLVATHPHADHIGSMAAVIRAMDIGVLIMPDVIHTTAVFERMLDAIEEKNLPVKIPVSGETFSLGGAEVQIIAPVSGDYKDLNNYSVVLRVQYGASSFLFTGDAEDISESEQLEMGLNLNSDVLKVGHHGSSSSTTSEYLGAVAPSYAVISCGADNDYGHPHKEVISRLNDAKITVLRTDLNGTVIFTTDGDTIEISSDIQPEPSGEINSDSLNTYIGNINSKIYHLPDCESLPLEKNRIYFSSIEETEGYRPCGRCIPNEGG